MFKSSIADQQQAWDSESQKTSNTTESRSRIFSMLTSAFSAVKTAESALTSPAQTYPTRPIRLVVPL